jgi:hypothetical protein
VIVFTLMGTTNFEGETLLGVYTSREIAERTYTQYALENSPFDDYEIHEVELDTSAEPRF